jgi:hypothetical protein
LFQDRRINACRVDLDIQNTPICAPTGTHLQLRTSAQSRRSGAGQNAEVLPPVAGTGCAVPVMLSH